VEDEAMKYLIHSTQHLLPAHLADVTGRALCNLGPAAWKQTPARSGYKAGEWQLVERDEPPPKVCGSCKHRLAGHRAFMAGQGRKRRRMGE
jgi:hypothetical protein